MIRSRGRVGLPVRSVETPAVPMFSPPLQTEALNDAMFQRYFDPITVKGTEILVQTVSMTANNVALSVIKDGQRSKYVLKSSYGGDDHNVGQSVVLPSGRIMAVCCSHAETTAMRYKVSNETSYPYTMSAERTITKPVGWSYLSYTQAYYLSDGTVRVFSRAYNSGTGDYMYYMFSALASAIDLGTETWTATQLYFRTSQRPYPCIRQNPSDLSRLDFFIEGANIAEGTTDIGHFYLKTVAGVDHYYKTNGTEIVSVLPFDLYADWTLVASVSGTGTEDYLHVDGGYDALGNPRSLVAYFPTGAAPGRTNVIFRMNYWNGSAWVQFRVGTQSNAVIGTGSGTMGCGVFDKADKNKIYLSETVSGVFQVREYTIDQAANTSTLVRTISDQTAKHDFRPFSTGLTDYPLAFIRDETWVDFTNWSSNMYIVGSRITPKLVLNLKLLEASGQTLADSSVNALDLHNGLDGSVTATDLQFVTKGISVASGDGAIMKTGAPPDLVGTNFYYAVVANTSGITGTGTHMYLGRDDTTARQFQFRINNGNVEFLWRKQDASAVTTVGGAITTGSATYRLVSVWMNNGVVKIYVDGLQLGSDGAVTTPGNASAATTGICLGSRLSAGTFANNYPGVIAAARVYRDVTTSVQVNAINADIIAQVLADKSIVL